MRLAIADPPYLGRAALWYGGRGRNKQGRAGRACGRGDLAAEYHPEAAHWDDPAGEVTAHHGPPHQAHDAIRGWITSVTEDWTEQAELRRRALPLRYRIDHKETS